MNVYFCSDRYDDMCGMYVIAENRNRARAMFSREYDIPYVDSRASIEIRRCEDMMDNCREQILDECDNQVLRALGLTYIVLDELAWW